MRLRLSFLWLFLAVTAVVNGQTPAGPATAARPNVVFILKIGLPFDSASENCTHTESFASPFPFARRRQGRCRRARRDTQPLELEW